MPNPAELDRRVRLVLVSSHAAMSTRQVALLAGISPTTASRVLRRLHEFDLVSVTSRGRASMWRATPSAEDDEARTSPGAMRRALILTALPLETSAVRTLLPGGRTHREPNGVRSYEAVLLGAHVTWQIRLQQVGVGNASAAAAAAHSLENFVPDVLLFVGVAGGLKSDDQSYGDVVIVNRAYNASGGKETQGSSGDAQFLTRPVSERIPLALEELAGQVAASMQLGASIAVGPVASTEAVLGTDKGPLFARIRSNLNDCVIVDMESYGVFVGARRLDVPAVSVRGISDFVTEKAAATDSERQPAAAKNAAKVALELLREADPQDVQPSSRQRPELVARDDGVARVVQELAHSDLPASAEPWHEMTTTCDPDLAEAARVEILGWPQGAIATHASRIADRPPIWLREDKTGFAWAMVAAVAETADSGVTSRLYEESARRAHDHGDSETAGLQRVSAQLARAREAVARGSDPDATDLELVGSLKAMNLTDAPAVDAFRTIITSQRDRKDHGDWSKPIDAAVDALALVGVLASDIGFPSNRWPEPSVGPSLSPALRRLLAGKMALQLATFHLLDERGALALQAADLAIRSLPRSGNAKLRRGQGLLALLHEAPDSSGHGRGPDVLAEVERLALEAYATLTEWDADGSEALALAARARVEAGDPAGALRLLLPPPDGSATTTEAASADVSRVLVAAAVMIGNHGTAIRAAEQLGDTTEGLLMKAQALETAPGMSHEARETYRSVLRTGPHGLWVLERALLGLARTGERLHELTRPAGEAGDETSDKHVDVSQGERANTEPSTNSLVRQALAQVRARSERGAEIPIGEAALRAGDADRALTIGLQHRDHVQGIDLAADAYEALGQLGNATDLVWEYGTTHADTATQLDAIQRAGRHGDFDRVKRFADAVIRDHTGEPRRIARQARMRASALSNDWPSVDTQARLLMQEAEEDSGAPVSPGRLESLRWARVEALFHTRQLKLALKVLTDPAPAIVDTRQQALLALRTVYAVAEESKALDEVVLDWVLTVASAWVDDEEVCRQAVGILIMMGGDPDLAQVARAREVIERYFERHQDNAQIRQIKFPGEVDEDGEIPEGYFDPLYEELRKIAHARTPEMRHLELELWRGRLPWSFMAQLLGRTYAGTLIRGGPGQHVVSTPWSPAPSSGGTENAHRALASGAVSADTSSLVIGPTIGVDARTLLGAFRKVHLADALRGDMFRARAELGRRGDTSIGWDTEREQPTITISDEGDVERWATEAEALCELLPLLSVELPDRSSDKSLGLDAVLLAERLTLPLWADDAAMRTIGAEKGVPTFSTLDLLAALRTDGRIEVPDADEVIRRSIEARIVDVALPTPWWKLAREQEWQARSFALAVSRPAAWGDPIAAFAEFRTLIDVLGRQEKGVATVETIAAWTTAAAHGLAWSLSPNLRVGMAANLMAWVCLNMEPALGSERIVRLSLGLEDDAALTSREHGQLLNRMYHGISNIGEAAFPEADPVRALTATLATTVRSVADAPTTMRIMLQALGMLVDQGLKERAIRALMEFPPTPIPE